MMGTAAIVAPPHTGPLSPRALGGVACPSHVGVTHKPKFLCVCWPHSAWAGSCALGQPQEKKPEAHMQKGLTPSLSPRRWRWREKR